ncbi:MAG: type VI secretion system baseplate subunit TssE [Planctomycetota bacterium]
MSSSSSGRPRAILRPSLLQRLLAGEDAGRPSQDLRVGLRELRDEVLRDLGLLLNTRATDVGKLAPYPEVADSVLAYGMPDVSSYSPSSDDDIEALMSLIAETIRRFEPRLDPNTVRVERATDLNPLSGGVDSVNSRSFRIAAMLHVEPIRERIQFDTRVDLDSGTVHVEDAGA